MAAKELSRVRPSFVERVSTHMISELLDDILKDSIVNSGEKDWILEENNIRRDKARRLIDTVIRKGERASGKFITHIKCKDPELYSELQLSDSQPAAIALSAAADHQMKEQEWSTTLQPSTDAFWKEKQSHTHVYQVVKNAMSNRVALLITNITFAHEDNNRYGAEVDEENMKKLLRSLGYEVVEHRNLTGKEIDGAVSDFSKHPKLKDTDSVVVVIMSHGELGKILGINHSKETPDEFPIDNIYTHLGSEKCPALIDKPKIIIIQACRGGERGSVIISDGPQLAGDNMNATVPSMWTEDLVEDVIRFVHKEKDFISLLSCTPNTVSYRNTRLGSFLIMFVVDIFNTFAFKDDIEELFRQVMCRFEKLPVQSKMQMPTKDRCSLTKKFYFYPGL